MTATARHGALIAAACLAVGGHPRATALADGAAAVAVLNFAQRTAGPEAEEYRWLEKGLADLVIADLSTRDGLSVVTREQMQLLWELRGMDELLGVSRSAPPPRAGREKLLSRAGEWMKVERRRRKGSAEKGAEKGRVALGDCSPRAPTDPYVRD